ncbi:PadR family transcriptional regulator [Actinoplanes lobatus]|uniref:PadR family transcriptional regulator n=1 Tax=Actinoplanes lobatus TaxID=113568 RepID=A0ABQ4AM25_9ACTN|nr:PadR family transcriptional regulator [Actinoplanes lobatus]GIE42051.1 PadR family transcriptional regulator [Actinoplanes lobatus]
MGGWDVRKTDRDLASLTVLALLMTGPRHAYEMHLLIEKTHKTFVTGLPRSLYHAVNRLVGGGEIRVSDVVREPGRPERTVYALTDQGRARLREWIGVLLREPDPDSSLLTAALSFAGCLPPETVAGLLRERQAGLEDRLAAAGAVPELPRILLIETEYEVSRLTAERDWVSEIAADIETGRLTWPADMAEVADVTPLLQEDG